MNDYKELIEKLRNQECLECVMWDDEQGCASMSTCIMFQQAADAIESLQRRLRSLPKSVMPAIVDKNNLRVSWPIINASIGRSLELRSVKDKLERVKKERDAAVEKCKGGTERMDHWIHAEERKPEDPEVVVLCIVSGKAGSAEFDNAIQLGTYDHDEDVWIIEGWELYGNLNVSYWMPLPELPWEEEDKP